MFDFDAGKFLIVGVIALLFIPPKDLPRAMRQLGQFVGKMRRMAAEFQGQFMDAMREADMADIRKEAQKLADAARVDASMPSVHELDRTMTRSVESKSVTASPSDSHAFEALQGELRPLLDHDAQTAAGDAGGGAPSALRLRIETRP